MDSNRPFGVTSKPIPCVETWIFFCGDLCARRHSIDDTAIRRDSRKGP